MTEETTNRFEAPANSIQFLGVVEEQAEDRLTPEQKAQNERFRKVMEEAKK